MEENTNQFSNIEINDDPVLEDEYDGMDVISPESNDHFITITVSEPQKIGEGMSSYLAYTIVTKTNIPQYTLTNSETQRRFSDFLALHTLLTSKYLRTGRIIPGVPSKNLIGTTKVKMSPQQSDSNSGSGMEWIEIRRAALERFLNRTAQHKILRIDPDFINFLQTDRELPGAINTSTLSGAGVMRLFNKFGETVNKITYKMDENDPWFDDKIKEIESLDACLQHLHSTIKGLVNDRKELATYTGLVSKAAALLSTCEEHTGLSRALSSLADVEEKIDLLRSEQANSDFFILAEFLKEYLGLFDAIKAVFHERVKVFQNWQHAQMQLTKRRETKQKIEASGRNDKSDQMQNEIEEWEVKVQRCQQEFDEISAVIKEELNNFNRIRVEDFRAVVKKYFESQMAHQQQLVKYWETFLPTTKEIF